MYRLIIVILTALSLSCEKENVAVKEKSTLNYPPIYKLEKMNDYELLKYIQINIDRYDKDTLYGVVIYKGSKEVHPNIEGLATAQAAYMIIINSGLYGGAKFQIISDSLEVYETYLSGRGGGYAIELTNLVPYLKDSNVSIRLVDDSYSTFEVNLENDACKALYLLHKYKTIKYGKTNKLLISP
jgi:hypothetical protein